MDGKSVGKISKKCRKAATLISWLLKSISYSF
jgi:hypothetical protein